nr:MFS transporter [Novosphingobium panipatense]
MRTRYTNLLAFSRFGAGVANMTYAGSLPFLLGEWGMSGTEAGSIQASFNLCYALSLLLCSWASDRFGPERIFVAANCLSALALIGCSLIVRSHDSAIIMFGLLAAALGGSYTPSIMLIAKATPASHRGSAIGLLLAGSSVGYFFAIAVCAGLIPTFGYVAVWKLLSVIPLLSAFAASVAATKPPLPVETASVGGIDNSGRFLSRNSILLTTGYTGHCWELLGMWAWMPAFLAFALAGSAIPSLLLGIIIAAALHLSGAGSTLVGGWASDRWGRKFVLVAVAALGTALSLIIGWTAALPSAVIVGLVFLYGFAALGDSGVLSTAMADAVPPNQLGRLLALRSILGFGAGAVSPIVFGWILDHTNVAGSAPTNWGWAFAVLGLGGAIATASALGLRSQRTGYR